MDTREAVERTLGGEPEAFAALVERYEGPLLACALARVYDREDAQDLCQETFLRAYLSLRTLRTPDAFGPWLFMILRRLSVDFLRGKWRQAEGVKKMGSSGAERSSDSRGELCAHDVANTIWRLVGQLDENSREVLALHYGQEMKVGEIAELTGLRESAVKMRLQKARLLLGQRAGELQGAWGQGVIPSLSAGIMEGVKAAPVMKAAPLVLGPLAPLLAFFGGMNWMQQKDLERWRRHIPEGMTREHTHRKRWFLGRMLAVIAFILLAPFLKAHIPNFDVGVVVAWLIFFGVAVKREMELVRHSESARFFLLLALVFVLTGVMAKVPGRGVPLACFSGMVLLLGVSTSATQAGAASILPGVWLMPVLKRKREEHPLTRSLSLKEIKPWVSMLYELGLVAPPVKKDPNGITVQLRLCSHFWSKLAGISHSTLRTETSGAVTCAIAPKDYIAVARQFGPVELPGRRQLVEDLSQRFALDHSGRYRHHGRPLPPVIRSHRGLTGLPSC